MEKWLASTRFGWVIVKVERGAYWLPHFNTTETSAKIESLLLIRQDLTEKTKDEILQTEKVKQLQL